VKRTRRFFHLVWVLPLVCAVPSAVRVSTYAIPVYRFQPDAGARAALSGAIHVHSNRSDGRGNPDEIAAAAREAGLDFVVLTDHNVAPEPARESHGVLLLSGAEVTTRDGHLLAFDFEGAPPAAGTPAHEVESRIRAQGGFTAVAHGHDHKAPWQRWDMRRVTGMEIYNAGADARRHLSFPFARVAGAALSYPLNANYALLLLHGRMARDLARFDELARARRMVAFCGLDAHGVPSYERLFRAMRTYLPQGDASLPGTQQTTRTKPSARALWDSLRAGRHYCALTLLGDASRFRFEATQDALRTEMGGELAAREPVTLRASLGVTGAERARILFFRDGALVHESRGSRGEHITPEPGAYRVEVRLDVPGFLGNDRTLTWIYSNPIYVRRIATITAPSPAATAR
jgi:hypothetical protein